eukprot:7587437-Alexandrium_andersonii.AAC.1
MFFRTADGENKHGKLRTGAPAPARERGLGSTTPAEDPIPDCVVGPVGGLQTAAAQRPLFRAPFR